MARRILSHDLQQRRAAPTFPPSHWPEGVGMEMELDSLWEAGWKAMHNVAGVIQQRDFPQRFVNHRLGDRLLRYRKQGDTS
eukprot:6107374-Alexandrium_andersonii.AAC.1